MVKKRKIAGGAPNPAAQAQQPKVKAEQKEEPVEEAQPSAPLKQELVENEADNNATNEETAMAEVKEEGAEEEDDDDENSPESIQSILEAFPKDQLVDLLRDAAAAHPSVREQIRTTADIDPAQRKVFVHGLGWDTTSEILTAAFSPYGEIEDLKVVMDKNTGKCKGYGFVLFRRRSGAKKALKEPQKKIGNRMAACQLASLGPVPATSAAAAAPAQAPSVSEYTQRKIFVSNVGPEVDPQKLSQFFAKFGEIEEGPLGLDKATGKPKGFALFVYKSVESAKKALQEPHKKFEGEVLHCQRAIDGPRPGKPGFTKNTGSSFQGRSNPAYGGGIPGAQVVAPAGLPGAGQGHLIAPAGPTVQVPAAAVAAPGLNPALGQALTAFLATQLGALGQGGAAAGPQQGYGYGAPGGPYGGPPQGPGRGGGGYMGGL